MAIRRFRAGTMVVRNCTSAPSSVCLSVSEEDEKQKSRIKE